MGKAVKKSSKEQLEAILMSYEKGIKYVVDNNIMQDSKTFSLLEYKVYS